MDYAEYKNSKKRIMFSDLFDTIVTNGGTLPDIIKLERVTPSPKKSFFEPDDTQILALISSNKDLHWKRFSSAMSADKTSRYVSIPMSDNEKTKSFSEMVFVERFKISVAHIEPLPRWTDLKTCFTDIMWDAWLEATGREMKNRVDFLRIVSVEKKETVLDFIRTGNAMQFVNFSRKIGDEIGPPLRPPNVEGWEIIAALTDIVGKCNIFTATFKDLPKDIDVKNDFITFSAKDLRK